MTSRKDQEQYWCLEEPYGFVTVKEFAEAFQSFHVGRKLASELSIPFDKSKSHPAALTTETFGLGKRELLKACMSREALLMKRNQFIYVFKAFQVSIYKDISFPCISVCFKSVSFACFGNLAY